jgi:LCP family protein required for cell wall assembly
MSQAQPLPPRRSSGRPVRRSRSSVPAARAQALAAAAAARNSSPNSSAMANRGSDPRGSRESGRSNPQPGRSATSPGARPGGWRRLPLLPFAVGLAIGYGLAGPLPSVLGGALAALQKGPAQLGSLVSPLAGIRDRPILVMGTDRVGDNTDVIFTLQVKDGTSRLTQVPRDTFVESQDYGVVKANALYAFGGMDAAKRELGTLLNQPLDKHLRVNLRAVTRIADALGGVEIDVPKRMYYVDNAQGLYIDLYPGRQVLQGEALEGFLRFRHDELGDIGRLERQKLVLQQVFSKLVQPGTLTRLPELMRIAGEDVDTNLSPVEMGQLLSAMATTRLSTNQLPGRLFWHNDLSFWMPDNNPRYGAAVAGADQQASSSDEGSGLY